MSIFSQDQSANFKNLIVSAKNMVPTESNIDSLNRLLKTLISKKNELTGHLNSNVTAGQKNTLQTYLDDMHDIINLTEARINELNNQEVGGSRRRKLRRKSNRKSRRKSSRKSRRKLRRKTSRK